MVPKTDDSRVPDYTESQRVDASPSCSQMLRAESSTTSSDRMVDVIVFMSVQTAGYVDAMKCPRVQNQFACLAIHKPGHVAQ